MKSLSFEEIYITKRKLLENVSDLIEEAELLLKHKHYARAFCLSHLASEELAKLPMLTTAIFYLVKDESFDWSKLDRRVRSHPEKILGVVFAKYMFLFNKSNDTALRDCFESLKHRYEINRLKNNSLYVGVFNNNICKPSEIISKKMASDTLKTAEKLFNFFQDAEALCFGEKLQFVKNPDFKALKVRIRDGLDKLTKQSIPTAAGQ